jgi:hypothetical protein
VLWKCRSVKTLPQHTSQTNKRCSFWQSKMNREKIVWANIFNSMQFAHPLSPSFYPMLSPITTVKASDQSKKNSATQLVVSRVCRRAQLVIVRCIRLTKQIINPIAWCILLGLRSRSSSTSQSSFIIVRIFASHPPSPASPSRKDEWLCVAVCTAQINPLWPGFPSANFIML